MVIDIGVGVGYPTYEFRIVIVYMLVCPVQIREILLQAVALNKISIPLYENVCIIIRPVALLQFCLIADPLYKSIHKSGYIRLLFTVGCRFLHRKCVSPKGENHKQKQYFKQ